MLMELTTEEIDAIATKVAEKLTIEIQNLFKKSSADVPLTSDTYATTKETADILGISVRSLTIWCRKALCIKATSRKNLLLPFAKVGKAYRFDRDLLAEGIRKGQFAHIPHQSLFEVANG